MKIFTVFIALCLLVACVFLTDHSFLEQGYFDDSQVLLSAYDHSNDTPVTVSKISLPIDRFLDDNQLDLSLVDTKIRESFYSLESLSSTLSSLGSSFLSFGEDLSSLIEDPDTSSLGYLYSHDAGYRSFVNSYVHYLTSLYNKMDISIIERYFFPRYVEFLPSAKSYLVDSSSFYPGIHVEHLPGSGLISTYSSSGVALLHNARAYFCDFKVSPSYHISIQDKFEEYHVSAPFIDTSFTIQGLNKVYIRAYNGDRRHPESMYVELISTPLAYDPVLNLIVER